MFWIFYNEIWLLLCSLRFMHICMSATSFRQPSKSHGGIFACALALLVYHLSKWNDLIIITYKRTASEGIRAVLMKLLFAFKWSLLRRVLAMLLFGSFLWGLNNFRHNWNARAQLWSKKRVMQLNLVVSPAWNKLVQA